MPQLVFLTEKRPLVYKVASWLAADTQERPWDLSETAIVLSTSAAGLRLRDQLVVQAAESGTGVLPPVFATPLALLDRALTEWPVAPRQSRLEAWFRAVRQGGTAAEDLLVGFPTPLPARESLRIAESLMDVCSLLAEGGLTPLSPEIFDLLSQDEDRWRNIRELYQLYLAALGETGQLDPNEARLRAVEEGVVPPSLRRVIIANVPDLNPLARRYYSRLEQLGVKIVVLVDAPDCEDASFDGWGMPDSEYWSSASLPLTLDQIRIAADPYTEGELVARLHAGGAAVCQVDERLASTLRTAFARHDRRVFNPGGESLASTEIGVLVKAWRQFCATSLVTDLRPVLECPAFLSAFSREWSQPPALVLADYDELRASSLIDTWSDFHTHVIQEATTFEPRADQTEEKQLSARARMDRRAAFVRLLEEWRQSHSGDAESVPGFIQRTYAEVHPEVRSPEGRALTAYGEVLRAFAAAVRPPDARIAGELLDDAVAQARVYEEHADDAVELNGWLEAAWLPDERIVLAGCAEGVLPAATNGHSFLPESARQALGLITNPVRLARDAFLLHNLLASRTPGAVTCLYGRVSPEGEPAKPSRLLFRCSEADLPARVGQLFGEAISLRETATRLRGWRLNIAPSERLAKIGVTAFGDYLTCPLRFYFKHVQKLATIDPQVAEMDAREFGTLFHRVVEAFACDEVIRDSVSVPEIEEFVSSRLEWFVKKLHGKNPSLPVRVQQESLRMRLRQFARIQAEERAAGWQIREAEYRFEITDTLVLAGLPLTASLDRVEVHLTSGQRRILDYKTFARDKTPEQAHLARSSQEPLLPGEEIFWEGKPRYWRNLQLPLYRELASHRWPGEEPPLVGYFLLPERVEDSRIELLDLNDVTSGDALRCAEAIAERVQRGIYWPPREVDFDDYEQLFLGDDPADVFSEASITYLQGDA